MAGVRRLTKEVPMSFITKYKRLCAFVLIFPSLFTACVSHNDTNPPILGSTAVSGKGFPQGTSDNPSTFFKLTKVSTDPTYGYSERNPIKVGGVESGPARERLYLNGLLGPEGQPIVYERQGSCCPFKTPNGIMGGGMLDSYSITYEGASKAFTLYINMYDESEMLIPTGLTAVK
jgi:hypothetical protein